MPKTVKRRRRRRQTKKGGDETLKQLCPISNLCVSLGQHLPIFNAFFDEYKFTYLSSLKPIGEQSTNGFIRALNYKRDDYSVSCILKCSLFEHADNLFLEWYVGHHFVNKMVPIFPCFLETLQLVKLKDAQYIALKQLSQHVAYTNPVLNGAEFATTMSMNTYRQLSCASPTSLAILIQYVENPISLDTLLIAKAFKDEYNYNVLLLQILLQIYIPLGRLSAIFTHNDLHLGNILLYPVPNNGYITLRYKIGEDVITMRTKYIVKIIDYGRGFFNWEDESTLKFLDELPPECKQMVPDEDNPGEYISNMVKKGYSIINDPLEEQWYIDQLHGNISKDLWPLQIFYRTRLRTRYGFIGDPMTSVVDDLFDSVVGSNTVYGEVPPTKTCRGSQTCNVIEASAKLCALYSASYANYIKGKETDKLVGVNSIGTLDIDVDNLTDSIFTLEQ